MLSPSLPKVASRKPRSFCLSSSVLVLPIDVTAPSESFGCKYKDRKSSQSNLKARFNESVPLRRVRTTRSSTHSYRFQISLPNPRTLSHKSPFIPRTCNLSNVLPSCFPESYNWPSFESEINKLDLISLSSWPFAFFFLPLLGLCIGHRGLPPT